MDGNASSVAEDVNDENIERKGHRANSGQRDIREGRIGWAGVEEKEEDRGDHQPPRHGKGSEEHGDKNRTRDDHPAPETRKYGAGNLAGAS